MKILKEIFIWTMIIVFLGGAGFFVYKHFFPDYEGITSEVIEAEPEFLYSENIYNAAFGEATESNMKVLDYMDNTDATYFKLYVEPDQYDPENQVYNLWTSNENDFEDFLANELVEDSELVALDASTDLTEKLFSVNWKNIGDDLNEKNDGYDSVCMEKVFGDAAYPAINKVNSYFGGNIDEYFEDHELVLSCENVQFDKIAIGQWRDEYPADVFFTLGTADVTVESAIGDLSSAEFLPEIGESRTVTIELYGIIYEKDFSNMSPAHVELDDIILY